MNNEWKMVPAVLLERISKDSAVSLAQIDQIRQILEAPMPPAGDVEVLAHIDIFTDSKVGLTDAGLRMALAGLDDVELVDGAHVTRLTAELDGLKDENDTLEHHVIDLKLANSHLQSELTKARELLGISVNQWDCIGGPSLAEINGRIRDYLATPIARQSAPAAKGGSDE